MIMIVQNVYNFKIYDLFFVLFGTKIGRGYLIFIAFYVHNYDAKTLNC